MKAKAWKQRKEGEYDPGGQEGQRERESWRDE